MKKILLPFFVIILVSSCLHAQDFVQYSGDTEKNLINTAKTADDFLKLSLSTEMTDAESAVLYTNFIQQIKQLDLQALAGDKSDRKLKKIYDVVHDHFLKKYNPSAHFGDFIVNGEYNHLSASILFAYVLESLSVPYQMTQYPEHVFVTANPGTNGVKFETINLTTGVYFISDQSKQRTVLDLIKNGYMDQSYAIRVGVEKAFDEFMYGKEDISLKEAVGVLYFNRGMGEIEAGAMPSAYADFYKSDILYPGLKNEYFKNIALFGMTNNFKYNDIAEWHALTSLDNSRMGTDNLKNYTAGMFQNFINDNLLNAGHVDKVAEVYNYLHSSITDTALRKQISKIYFVQSANYYVIINKYDEAFDCAIVAYQLEPNNPIILSNLEKLITQKYGYLTPTTQSLNTFDAFISKHPVLKNDAIIEHIYEYFYGVLGNEAYLKGNSVTGEKYMKTMVDFLEAHPENNDDRNNIVIAGLFSAASTYYFKKQQRQKAIEVLKTGLKYVPTDGELQRKLAADSQTKP